MGQICEKNICRINKKNLITVGFVSSMCVYTSAQIYFVYVKQWLNQGGQQGSQDALQTPLHVSDAGILVTVTCAGTVQHRLSHLPSSNQEEMYDKKHD